jgi:hypothetical protein
MEPPEGDPMGNEIRRVEWPRLLLPLAGLCAELENLRRVIYRRARMVTPPRQRRPLPFDETVTYRHAYSLAADLAEGAEHLYPAAARLRSRRRHGRANPGRGAPPSAPPRGVRPSRRTIRRPCSRWPSGRPGAFGVMGGSPASRPCRPGGGGNRFGGCEATHADPATLVFHRREDPSPVGRERRHHQLASLCHATTGRCQDPGFPCRRAGCDRRHP